MLRAALIAALALPLGAAGCAAADAPAPDAAPPEAGPTDPPADAQPDGLVRLGVGESAAVDGRTLRFVEVVEDSRCPEGTECVWAGRAVLRVAVGGETAALSVPHGGMRDGETSSAVLGELDVTAASLDPYPGSAEAEAGAPVTASFEVR